MKHVFSNQVIAGIAMKAFIFWSVSLVMFTGCAKISNDETSITLLVQPSSLNFKSTGEKQDFKIFSNDRWTVSNSAPSWLTLSATSGSNDSIITVSAASNTSTSQRNATITIKSVAPYLTRTIQVMQEPIITQDTLTPHLTVSTDSMSFIADGGQKPFTVTSNTNWTVDVNSLALPWLTLSAKSGSNNGIINVSAESNSSASQRNATITVNSLTQGVTPQTIKISQEPFVPYLNILFEEHLLYIGSDNQQFLDINSNVDWNVSIDYSYGCGETNWLSVSPSSGRNNGKITLTASEMPEVGDRTARLRVSGGGLTIEKYVQQVKVGYLSISPSSLSFESTGESKQLTIHSDASWEVYCSDTWLKVSLTEGVRDGTITVTAEPSTRTRTSTLYIGLIRYNCSIPVPDMEKINVTQAGAEESEMIFVQGGTFIMGCTSEQVEDCRPDETPTHQVTLSDFYIGKYEVTQGQWKAIMGNNPSNNTSGDNYPVEKVSWNDIVGTSGATMVIKNITYYANGFIYKLNQLTGKQYRLPTEAEWEYAARGGRSSKGYKYSGSNTISDVAWYWEQNKENRSHAVGTKASNELGIYDMSGNVSEWCSDWFGSYNSSPQTNPTGGSSRGGVRMFRGGSWAHEAGAVRVSYRGGGYPYDSNINLGFRLACNSN